MQGDDFPEDVGDEALLYASTLGPSVPVVVSANRSDGAECIEASGLADVILLDDGFQHRRLNRDVNILLLDVSSEASTKKWRDGKLLPAGYLREPLDQALDRADITMFVKKTNRGVSEVTQIAPRIYRQNGSNTGLFELRPETFIDVYSQKRYALDHFQGQTLSAFTAIASPDSFTALLKSLDIRLGANSQSYRDHHRFSSKEWESVSDASAAPIITTTKDAVKLRNFLTGDHQLFALELSGEINDRAQRNTFWQTLESNLAVKTDYLDTQQPS